MSTIRHHMRRSHALSERPSSHPEAGFTLLEVVIALGILAISLSVIFGIISNGVWQVRQADAGAKADLLVQSVLAKVGTELPLREGQATGEFAGGFTWRLELKRFGGAADRLQWPLSAYVVTAEVSWNDAAEWRVIAMRTLRLGPKEGSR